jgi:hypothetical protein
MSVSMSNAQCNAAGSMAINGLNQQAINQLSDIKALRQSSAQDTSSIMSKVAELGKEFIPPALEAVIEGLIKRSLTSNSRRSAAKRGVIFQKTYYRPRWPASLTF